MTIRFAKTAGLAIAAATLLAGAGPAAAAPVTLESLLAEMVDRDAAARLPEPAYTLGQASSYDRDSVAPDRPGWFANDDWSRFVRSERNGDRVEWVMMDAAGPGAIVRIWSGGPEPKGTIRVYLDGAATPAIQGKADALIGGTALVGPPLSAVRSRGLNLFLPIPYATHCKVTYDGPNVVETRDDADRIWYNLEYRTYAPGTPVRPFAAADLAAARGTIDRVVRALDGAEVDAPAAVEPIPPGKSLERTFKGPGAIRDLRLRLKARDPEAALRSTVLILEFDGEATGWCPVGDFFGTGVGLNPFRTAFRSAGRDGLACRRVMPFRESGTIRLANLGREPVEVALAVETGPWTWDARSMHFHATWHQHYPIDTATRQDFNYLAAAGRGVLVGDSLVVMNPVAAWWGEGDEKISVDGERFPSHFGTGTEDYYGYAWGDPALFSAPFHAQARCDGPGNKGYTCLVRDRALDAIPFARSLRFDMEAWHWAPTAVLYAATTHWYARPGAQASPGPDPAEARRPLPAVPAPPKVAGALEGETLKVLEKTGGIAEAQEVADLGWSGGAQLWWRDARPGDRLVLALPVARPGRYRLLANLTRARDYGIVRFRLDGADLGDPIDLYSPAVAVTGGTPLGSRELTEGEHRLEIEVVGAAERAEKRHMLGLDYLKLDAEEPQK